MREISKYIEAKREASRTEAAPGSESGARATKELPTRMIRQAVPKRPRASEPSQKKTRKKFEVAAPS